MKKFDGRWWLTMIVIPGVLLATIVIVPLMYADQLPDTIARHWDLSGNPDGASSLSVFVALMGAFAALPWVALLAADRRGNASEAVLATVYFIEGLLVATTLMTVQANLDVSTWQDADEFGIAQLLVVVGAGAATGAIGWFLGDSESTSATRAATEPLVTSGVAPDENAVWISGAETRIAPVGALVLIVSGLVAGGTIAVLFVLVAVAIIFFSAARVSVNRRGVRVGVAWWGWPHKFIPLSDVTRAEVLDVEPMSYGGWGLRYRGSGDEKTTALVVRRGPAIRLVRTDQRDLVVTVDDAETGAGLINDFLSQHQE